VSPVQASCPSCGGPCEFKAGNALVTICPYCRSIVGRGDKGLEDLGKVADVSETGSPLDLWLKGRFDAVPFTLTGRAQFSHPAGGVWDEWYASFADGRWGWLAEAGGRFYLTFQKPAPPDLPSFANLRLGQTVHLPGAPPLLVAEKNHGKTAGARGDLPYRLLPGQDHLFADLSGPHGAFGTLDYSEEAPQVFLGREVTLDELGVPPSARRKVTPGQGPRVAALSLNCPKCGGALALRAPDRSERVGCPNCGSLLDVHEGKLTLLQSLKPPKIKPIVELGTVAKYENVEWTFLGFMRRAVTIDETDYFWEEYLLYQPHLGFRWLTRDDDHWNWVVSLPPGSVSVDKSYATYADRPHRLFQKAEARVVFVIGEFYWKVQAGEKVQTRDYVSAPYVLSEEVTKEGDKGEINWSRGTYLTPETVQKMFGLQAPLPAPASIGANQPFPHTGVYRQALWLLALALVLGGLVWLFSPNREVFRQEYQLAPLPDGARSKLIVFDEPIELRGRRNVKVTLTSKSNGWAHLSGSLDRERPPPSPGTSTSPGPAHQEAFTLTAEAHRSSRAYLSSVPAGRYHARFDVQWQDPKQSMDVEVRMAQGVAHLAPLVVVLLAIGAGPFLVGIYQLIWEARRWQNSSVG
jgi:hypothetical protein